MIAHRLSTILHAQTIFVLEKGRIVESGNHAMWRQQIGERPAPWAPNTSAAPGLLNPVLPSADLPLSL